MLHWYSYVILAAVGFSAGIIDTLAGGGGLIALPALLNFNLAPAVVLGTNKFQAACGEFNASLHFFRRKKFNLKELGFGLLMLVLGSTIGAVIVQILHPHTLQKLIPWLLLAILIYTILSPRPVADAHPPKLSPRWFYILIGLPIGMYNGFFGPGTGSFLIVSIMVFLGCDIVKSTIISKPLNFAANFVGLLWFIFGGNVNYSIGLVMALGQLLGTNLGARLVIYRGNKIIKPIYISVVAVMTLDLFIKYY